MKKNLRNYQEKLFKDLRDPELAHHYLNEALVDEDPRILALALKNVCEAQCLKDHTPNKITQKALESVKTRKNLQAVDSVEELCKKLDQ